MLVGRENFGNHAWICETQQEQKYFDSDVKNDSDDSEADRSFEGSDDVEEDGGCPEHDMSTDILPGL